MQIVVLILLLLILWQARVFGYGRFHTEYCTPGKTATVKGIFVLIVFLSHMRAYVTLTPGDKAALSFVSYLGQLMVVPFLFYSGYGVMESIQRKGLDYVRRMPFQRILKTLLRFDMVVLIYLCIRLIFGDPVTIRQVLLALTGWGSIGNSNWFVFIALLLYGLTFLSFLRLSQSPFLGASVLTVLAAGAVFVLAVTKDSWWHDTMLCYVLGVWFSLLRRPLEKWILRNDMTWLAALLLALAGFLFLRKRMGWGPFYPHLCGLAFSVLLILLTAKLSLNNPFLHFLGTYTFELYLLQRIPMKLMLYHEICTEEPALFFLLSFGITCVLAVAFRRIAAKLDAVLFRSS